MNYKEYKFGEVTENFDTKRVPLSESERSQRHGQYRYYGAQEVIDYIDDYIFDGEYLLIAEDGNNLLSSVKPLCSLVNGKFWVNNHAHIVKGNQHANTKYLLYLLNNINIKSYVTGSAQPKLNQANLNKIKVRLPEITYQNIITRNIGYFDEAISVNLNLISYLEEYTQLLFHKWFVDFNFPDNNGNPYMDSGGEMVEINGKMIPKGWKTITLAKIVTKSTESVTPNNHPDKLFNHYSIPVFDVKKSFSKELGSTIESSKYLIQCNSVLVSKLNPWFKRVVYPYKIEEAICSTEFVVMIPKKDNLREYLYCLTNTNNFIKYCTRAASGTSNSHKRVSPNYMLKYKINYQEDILSLFNQNIQSFIIKIAALNEENLVLQECRDLLIKKLIK